MSLVLEALKKADAERERERSAVPDLHARPLPLAEAPANGRSPALAWGVAAVAVGVAGVLGWQLLRPAATPAAPPTATAPALASAPAPAVAAAPATPPPAAMSAAPPAPAPVPAPSPAPAPVAAAPQPAPRPAPAPKPAPAPAPAPAPVVIRAPAPAPAAPAETAPAAPESGRIYDDVQALPEDVRRGVPRLTIGGAMYSESATNRMLIVNGQLFRENDRLADDLVLEQIALKSAVLRYRSYRFRIRY